MIGMKLDGIKFDKHSIQARARLFGFSLGETEIYGKIALVLIHFAVLFVLTVLFARFINW